MKVHRSWIAAACAALLVSPALAQDDKADAKQADAKQAAQDKAAQEEVEKLNQVIRKLEAVLAEREKEFDALRDEVSRSKETADVAEKVAQEKKAAAEKIAEVKKGEAGKVKDVEGKLAVIKKKLAAEGEKIADEVNAAKKKGIKPDAEVKKDAVKKDAVKKDAEVKKDAVKKDAVKKDAVKKDAVKKDAVKKDAVKKDAVKKDAVKKDAVKKDAVKKDAVKKDAVKKDAVKKDAVKKDPDQQPKKTKIKGFAPKLPDGKQPAKQPEIDELAIEAIQGQKGVIVLRLAGEKGGVLVPAEGQDKPNVLVFGGPDGLGEKGKAALSRIVRIEERKDGGGGEPSAEVQKQLDVLRDQVTENLKRTQRIEELLERVLDRFGEAPRKETRKIEEDEEELELELKVDGEVIRLESLGRLREEVLRARIEAERARKAEAAARDAEAAARRQAEQQREDALEQREQAERALEEVRKNLEKKVQP